MHGILSDFWFLLNSNILLSSEDITLPQKSFFLHTFYRIHVCYLFKASEHDSGHKNHHHVLTLFLLIL